MKNHLNNLIRTMAFAAVTLTLLTLVSCGGGGYAPSIVNGQPTLRGPLRPLPEGFSDMKAIAYSPYRHVLPASSPDPARDLPLATVGEDLHQISDSGFKLIRIYSAQAAGEKILSTIKNNKLDLKVMLGAYLRCEREQCICSGVSEDICTQEYKNTEINKNKAANLAEIESLQELANKYSDIVIAVSVGNENLMNLSKNSVESSKMVDYLRKVHNSIVQPVTTSDHWEFYANERSYNRDKKEMEYQAFMSDKVLGVVDFASIHIYPMWDAVYRIQAPIGDAWDWRQKDVDPGQRANAMMNAAANVFAEQYQKVRSYLDKHQLSHMPIIVGETGWKTSNEDVSDVAIKQGLSFMASIANQSLYLEKVTEFSKSKGIQTIWFTSFDEPWKEADDNNFFGIYDDQGIKKTVAGSALSWVDLIASKKKSSYSADWNIEIKKMVEDDKSLILAHWNYENKDGTIKGTTGYIDKNDGDAWVILPKFLDKDDKNNVIVDKDDNPMNWGWGASLIADDPSTSAEKDALHNVSSMYPDGYLSFDIKTTYTGKLLVGAISNDQDALELQNYVTLENGKYGFSNAGEYVTVSIPLKDFLKYPQYIAHPFMIAEFGNNLKNSLPEIRVRNILYSATKP